MTQLIDLTGMVFGRLTVLHRDGDKGSRWICACSCKNPPNIKSIHGSHLKGGKILSCGCYVKQRTSEATKKYNKYFYKDEETMYAVANNNDKIFYFSTSCYEKIKYYCWRIDSKGYVVTNNPENGKYMSLHRFLMDFPDLEVDHKNRNPLDNRLDNLRLATHSANNINKGLQSNNVSGVAGVRKTKHNSWLSSLRINNKSVFNKTYKIFEDAVIARLLAELKYIGPELAPQRHLFKEYGII